MMKSFRSFFLLLLMACFALPFATVEAKKNKKEAPVPVKIVKASETKYSGAKVFGQTSKKPKKKGMFQFFKKGKKQKRKSSPVTKIEHKKIKPSVKQAGE